jgi:hypothetical protein
MAQVVVGPDSHIYQVNFLTGHNNDAGAFKITGLNASLFTKKVKLLADGGSLLCSNLLTYHQGYSHCTLVTPDQLKGKAWNNTQKSNRAIVETVFGQVKNWEVARNVFRGAPEIQTLALLVVYQLTAQKLRDSPLRE